MLAEFCYKFKKKVEIFHLHSYFQNNKNKEFLSKNSFLNYLTFFVSFAMKFRKLSKK